MCLFEEVVKFLNFQTLWLDFCCFQVLRIRIGFLEGNRNWSENEKS